MIPKPTDRWQQNRWEWCLDNFQRHVAPLSPNRAIRWGAGGVFWRRLVQKCCPNGPLWGERAVFFGGVLSKNVVPTVHFGNLKIVQIDTKIDAEQVTKNESKFIRQWRQNDWEFDEQIHLFAKGWNYIIKFLKSYCLRFWCSNWKNKSIPNRCNIEARTMRRNT